MMHLGNSVSPHFHPHPTFNIHNPVHPISPLIWLPTPFVAPLSPPKPCSPQIFRSSYSYRLEVETMIMKRTMAAIIAQTMLLYLYTCGQTFGNSCRNRMKEVIATQHVLAICTTHESGVLTQRGDCYITTAPCRMYMRCPCATEAVPQMENAC